MALEQQFASVMLGFGLAASSDEAARRRAKKSNKVESRKSCTVAEIIFFRCTDIFGQQYP